ncbi:MAG: hypothetical protein ACPGO3_00485 [Magnetospiraceae bacterium]
MARIPRFAAPQGDNELFPFEWAERLASWGLAEGNIQSHDFTLPVGLTQVYSGRSGTITKLWVAADVAGEYDIIAHLTVWDPEVGAVDLTASHTIKLSVR